MDVSSADEASIAESSPEAESPVDAESAEDASSELADDAANYNWGGNWQIATDAVFGELHDNCDIDFYAEINGVKGKRFTSRINGNSIFIPYSGFLRYNSVPNGVGNMFLFFLRDLYFCQATYGFYIGWGLTKQNHYDYTPWDGVSVRPVYPKE